MCHSTPIEAPEYLWVDAICIDQKNLREKESQVSMMDSVFGGAEKVVVWLGKDMSDFDDFAWSHSDTDYKEQADTDGLIPKIKLNSFEGKFPFNTPAGEQ